MTHHSFDRTTVEHFLARLAEAWPEYRRMGWAISQRCSKEGGDIEFVRGLLVDPGISPGTFTNRFTGVQEIVRIVGDEVEFIDNNGETYFASITISEGNLKLTSLKFTCPECFGEPQDPVCGICSGSGKF
jgi:hypothetical protein